MVKWRKPLAGALALAAAAALALWLRGHGFSLGALTAWLEGLGPWGPVYWMLIVLASVVFLLPVPILAALSGFLFGAIPGALYNVIGMSAGCTIAFLLGRLFLARRARFWMEKHPRLRAFNRGLENQGWTFILSTRLLPGFPIKASNYLFGGLGYPLKDFLIGSPLGLLPYQFTGAYAGSLLADLSDPGQLAAWSREPLGLAVSLAGLAAAAALLFYCIRRAVRGMREQGIEA
jgi:uncharacterized membrane protein YdjX (TVP38/TMEM64 family)